MKKKTKSKARPKAKPKTRKATKARAKAKAPKRRTTKPLTAKKSQKPQAPKPTIIAPPNSVLLGRVEDYYAHIGVIALTLKGDVKLGDHLHILGHTTNLEQSVDSMQINHQAVTEAHPKDAVGIKVTARVRRRDHVFLIKG